MEVIESVVVLLAFVAGLAFVARRIGIPYPILLVLGGLVIGFVPGLPHVQLNPDLVLLLFLPPILFSAAYFSSPRELWRNRRPLSLLVLGLVLTTTLAVALVITWLVPAMPLPAAVALGAIISPTDAIAATSIARRLGLPRRVVTIIEGESLLNDATALVTYRFAVAAALTGVFSLGDSLLSFLAVAVGGVLIGLAVGSIANFLFTRLEDPPVEVLVSLLTPFAAYLPADSLHVSGVLAAVSAGLWHGWRAPRVLRSETRVLGSATWETMLFVVNGMAFLLVGLQLPSVLRGVQEWPTGELVGLAAAVSATVILVRLAWVFPATYLPRLIVPGLAIRDPAPPRSIVVVLGWMGMRGAVSLAAALALPTDPLFPQRDLIVFLTLAVVLATLVGQGLTLPWLIRRLGVGGDVSEDREALDAQRIATESALRRLDELETEIPGHIPLIEALREGYLDRAGHYDRRVQGDGVVVDPEELDHAAIRRAVLAAERSAVIEARERGEISDEALRRIEREIDLAEVRSEA